MWALLVKKRGNSREVWKDGVWVAPYCVVSEADQKGFVRLGGTHEAEAEHEALRSEAAGHARERVLPGSPTCQTP